MIYVRCLQQNKMMDIVPVTDVWISKTFPQLVNLCSCNCLLQLGHVVSRGWITAMPVGISIAVMFAGILTDLCIRVMCSVKCVLLNVGSTATSSELQGTSSTCSSLPSSHMLVSVGLSFSRNMSGIFWAMYHNASFLWVQPRRLVQHAQSNTPELVQKRTITLQSLL